LKNLHFTQKSIEVVAKEIVADNMIRARRKKPSISTGTVGKMTRVSQNLPDPTHHSLKGVKVLTHLINSALRMECQGSLLTEGCLRKYFPSFSHPATQRLLEQWSKRAWLLFRQGDLGIIT
jgi:hypothetical protein